MAQTRLRLFWWGNPERDKRTFQVVDVYKQKNADVQVDAEAIGWTDYWPKMATRPLAGTWPTWSGDGLPLSLRVCAAGS